MSRTQERRPHREGFADSVLSRADRTRLLDRLDEMADLDREMRRPGTLARPDTAPITPSTPRKDPAR